MNTSSPPENSARSPRWLWRFVRHKRVEAQTTPEDFGFIVDTSKPPIFPPLRIVKEYAFPFMGSFQTETDFSDARASAWREYIAEYLRASSLPNAKASQPGRTDHE